MKEKFAKLIDVKSIVTIAMTVAMVMLLFTEKKPDDTILALYCTSYGSIVTYFFTKKKEDK